jgi:outer membrane immunogenic protein
LLIGYSLRESNAIQSPKDKKGSSVQTVKMAAIVSLAVIATSSFAPVTWAADLPLKAPPPAAVADPGWTGFYIGGHAGYGWGQDGGTSVTDYPPGTFGPAFTIGQIPRSVGADPRGAIGGAQFGYNLQVTPQWVLGLQADFSASSIKGAGDYSFATIPGVAFGATTHVAQSLTWLATVRARAGYTFDHLLVFGTGGLALGGIKSDFELNSPGGPATITASQTTTRSGWAAGAGAEYALTSRWSASVEWLHYDLGHVSFSAPEVLAGVPQPFGITATSVTKGDILSAALNYRL